MVTKLVLSCMLQHGSQCSHIESVSVLSILHIKSRSTASAQLSAYADWLQTHRQNGSAVRVSTDGRTDRRTDATKYIISLASRSIKIWALPLCRSQSITIMSINIRTPGQCTRCCVIGMPEQDVDKGWCISPGILRQFTLSILSIYHYPCAGSLHSPYSATAIFPRHTL